jgi:sugar phosphate isomerase/epimerase
MSQMTTYRWSFLEDVIHYQQAGINRMAIWRPKLADFGEERCIELIRDAGMEVSSLGWAGGFTGGNGHTFVEAVDDARSAILTAAELGAESLTIISGGQHHHIRSHARRLLREALEQILDVAEEHNVTLALQPMHPIYQEEWTFLISLDETQEILEAIDHPRVQMAFGTYHLWQEPRLIECLPAIVPMIASVQVSDWRPPRCDNDRHLPGDGMIPLAEILSTLHECGYRGSYEIEIWSAELWKSDYAQLLERSRRQFLSLFSGVTASSGTMNDLITEV